MQQKPNLDVILERLSQNTKLTEQVRKEVQTGFAALNSRVSTNTDGLRELQFWRKYEEENRREAAENARKVIEEAAAEAKKSIDTPATVGSSKWLLVTLVTIILALVAALGAR